MLKSWVKSPMIERSKTEAKNAIVLNMVNTNIQNKIQVFKRQNLKKVQFTQNQAIWENDVDKISVIISKMKNIVNLKEIKDIYQLTENEQKLSTQLYS